MRTPLASSFTLLILWVEIKLRVVCPQRLETVSLCSESPQPASRSGLITYDPTITGNHNCRLNLTGIKKLVHLSLVGVLPHTSTTCVQDETLLRINDLKEETHCTGHPTMDVTIVQVTNDQLIIEEIKPGNKSVHIEYHHSKSLYHCLVY
jgi:hypothetical protein